MLYGWLVINLFDECFKTSYFDEYVKNDIKLNLDSLPRFPSECPQRTYFLERASIIIGVI